MKKALIVFSGLLFITLMVLPCASGCAPAAGPGKEPVRIGALESMTGDIAFWGPDSIASVNIALDEWNHEVAGRPIEYYYEDDGSTDPVMSLEHTKKLVESDKVDVILQPSCGGPFGAMREWCNGTKTLSIGQGWRGGNCVPWGLSEEVIGVSPEERYDIVSPAAATPITYAEGKYAYEVMGARTAVTIGHDYETGYMTVGGFVDGFTAAGGKILQQQWVPFGTTDFAPYLTVLKEADITAVWCTGPMQPLFVRQYHEFGLLDKQPMIQLLNDSFYEPDLAELGDWTMGNNMYVVTEFPASIGTPEMNSYIAKFRERTGRWPNPCTGYGAYVATNIYLTAVEALGGNTDDTAVRDEIIGTTYNTLKGPMTFVDDGYPVCKGVFVCRVERVHMFGEDVLTFVPIAELEAAGFPYVYDKP